MACVFSDVCFVLYSECVCVCLCVCVYVHDVCVSDYVCMREKEDSDLFPIVCGLDEE